MKPAPKADREWLRSSLREQLELLASPASKALASLPDFCVKADELALDFDSFYHAYVGNFGRELSEATKQTLSEIDRMFIQMSGPEKAELWSEQAVATRPEWSEVRRLATLALKHFDETL